MKTQLKIRRMVEKPGEVTEMLRVQVSLVLPEQHSSTFEQFEQSAERNDFIKKFKYLSFLFMQQIQDPVMEYVYKGMKHSIISIKRKIEI
ncbi:hypothetical protein JTB14_015813 [Gonioctena quinquepunctata]|nr:hypothetical protein JTB14_015813 [Gonioctena quinquepunctata]